jgi:hypothetical protein
MLMIDEPVIADSSFSYRLEREHSTFCEYVELTLVEVDRHLY